MNPGGPGRTALPIDRDSRSSLIVSTTQDRQRVFGLRISEPGLSFAVDHPLSPGVSKKSPVAGPGDLIDTPD